MCHIVHFRLGLCYLPPEWPEGKPQFFCSVQGNTCALLTACKDQIAWYEGISWFIKYCMNMYDIKNAMLPICTHFLNIILTEVYLLLWSYIEQFCKTCHNPSPHGKNSWLWRYNLEVILSAKCICSVLNEMEYKSEMLTLRNVLTLFLCKLFYVLSPHF